MDGPSQRVTGKAWTVLIFLVVLVAVVLFFYYDRNHALTNVFRSWGTFGIVICIMMMALICLTPVPSEGLLLLYLKIYDPFWGAFYSWLGSIVSSLIVFVIARKVGRPLLQHIITANRFSQVDNWVRSKGTVGLLIVRLLPIPGTVVSYVVGTMPSVGLWSFVWTAAVTIIPYYVGAMLIFLGVSNHLISWLAIGLSALAVFWVLAYYVRKKWGKVF